MKKAIRTQAAQHVANHLIPAETALDHALMSVAALTSALVTARLDASLSASTGHEAFTHIGTATTLLTQARSELIHAHKDLAQAKIDIGLREVSFGNLMGCPSAFAEPSTNLMSIVA